MNGEEEILREKRELREGNEVMESKPKGKRRVTGDRGNTVCWGVCENKEQQGHTLCSLTPKHCKRGNKMGTLKAHIMR